MLTDVTFSVAPGNCRHRGRLGLRQSTLLHLLGGLDTPTTGSVTLMGDRWLPCRTRRAAICAIVRSASFYQFHHLLAELTAVQNVALALRIRRAPVAIAEQKARQLLEIVGWAIACRICRPSFLAANGSGLPSPARGDRAGLRAG